MPDQRTNVEDDLAIEELARSRARDADSSLQPQYEDHILPDRTWGHEHES